MPIVKRINKYQGLRDIDVFIEEKGLNSEYFNVTGVPSEVPQGKSSFLVGGSPFLKNNIELKIEMIDSAGNTIYMEPVSNYLESGARRVSIEVYPNTAPGTAKLYVLGELKRKYKQFIQPPISTDEITNPAPPFSAADPPSQAFLNQFADDVPSNFQGVYNVRYEMPVQINTTIPNTQPILFYKQPRLTVSEIVKGFVLETAPSSSYVVSGTLSINRTPESQPEPAPVTPPDGQPEGLTLSDRFDVGRGLSIFKNRRSSKRDPYRNSLFGKRGRVMRRSSPEVDKSTGVINDVTATPENAVNKITSTFVGETLKINNITIDTSKIPQQVPFTVTGSYQTEIKSVLNDSTFVPLEDFTVTLENGEKFPADITSADFTASIHPTPGFVISETEFRSFADITIGNLRTFSGDVYKAVVYGKSKGSLGDFEPMYEAFIESSEVLVDKLSPTGFTSTGYFFTQSIVDAYWDIEGGSHTTSLSNPDPVGTAVESDDIMIDGVMISGSNFSRNAKVNFRTKHLYDLEPNVAYNVQFNTHFFTAPKEIIPGEFSENDAVLEVYVTGSKAGNKELLGRVDIPSSVPEGRIDNIFKTFISAPVAPKMALEFHVKAGRFIIQDLSVRPMSETNFNPDYHRVIVPMPHPMPVKPDNYDFVVELFDVNNNLAETFATAENVEFTGAPLMISGPGNFLSGSMMLGTGMELYGGSAFLRTAGYRGMEYTIANNLGGFMVFSGSIGGPSAPTNLITSSEDYTGVGFEVVDAHDSNNVRFLKFGTNPSRFEVVTDTFFLGKPRDQTDAMFVSGSSGRIEISSSDFHLTPVGNVTGSNILLGNKNTGQFMQFANNQLTVQGNLSVDQIFTPATINSSPSNISNASSSITADGFAKFTSASIAGFEVSTVEIKSADESLRLKSSGQITGSNVLFSGGRVANWDIIGDTLSSVNGQGKGITLDADASTPIIKIEEDSNNKLELYHTTNSDWGIKGISGGNIIFRLGNTNKISGWTIGNTSLSGGAGASFIALVPGTGIQMGDETFSSAPFSVTNTGVLKATSGEVGGWTLGAEELTGGDMIIRRDGTIESAGFASDVAGSGFRLTAMSGGFLEVENARIRGTLSTAVFEKESVNAVGGQLYVANSTVLTASADNPGGNHTATQRTMSVVNATGFTGSYSNNDGEILSIKKVSSTGFNTEYILVQSASRFDPTSETDFSGNLFVVRGYGQGTNGDSGSLGGPAGSATSYSGSQVIVSTGRVGSGYIRLNANPNDSATPFIDIVERTGSSLYALDLKARLGDLSGLSSDRLHGTNPAGQFGLYSKNVFLEGGITANTGSIAGIKMRSGKLFTGLGVHGGATTGFFASESGDFSLKDKLIFNQATNTLTLKGALRQTSDGTTIPDFLDRGNWTSNGAGTVYSLNDLVQYNDGTTTSTYKCVGAHTSTNDNDTSTGRPDVNNNWAVYAAGSTGAPGAAAKGLTVTLDSQTFAFDDNSDTSSTPASIIFSINQQNLSGNVVTSDITITDSGGSTITNPSLVTNVTNGTGTVSGSLSFATNLGGDKSKLPVTISATKDSITDSVTLFKIEGGSDGAAGQDGQDGQDAYTVIVTNESHTVPQASVQAGSAFDLNGSGTDILVFRGITQLTGSLSSTLTTGKFSASFVGDNFTPGTPTIVNNNISFADMTVSPTEDSGSITFTIHAEGSASFTKLQSFTVNQSAGSGSDGSDGDPGAAGPGITFTGVWESGRSYVGTASARDTVKEPGGNGFWMARVSHNSDVSNAPPSSGTTSTTQWESFGASFSSVSTDILLAQDSTITRGLVIGNTDGTGSFIRSVDKIGLGLDSGSGFFLSSSGQFSFQKTGSNASHIQMDTSGIEISSSNFHLTTEGNVTMSGEIVAEGGRIAGYTISGNDLQTSTGNMIIEGGVGGSITLGAGFGASPNRQIILNSDDTSGANEVRISVGHGTQTSAPFQVNAVGAMTSSAAKISGSDINIQTPKFNLVEGNVTMSGDLSADTGNFKDVNILGSLVRNTSGNGTLNLVETWLPETGGLPNGNSVSGDPNQRVFTSLTGVVDNLQNNSIWGWTDSGPITNSTRGNFVTVYTDASNNTQVPGGLVSNDGGGAFNPNSAIFKGTNQMEGRAVDTTGTNRRIRNSFYDSLVYKTGFSTDVSGNINGEQPMGQQGGIPKLGISMTGTQVDTGFTLTSGAIGLGLNQTDFHECNLEFASRDGGNFGGFASNLEVAILKASDNSVLYTETKTHSGSPKAWINWSIPMVTAAGLVTAVPVDDISSINDDAFVIISSIKIRLSWTDSGIGGGGAYGGVVLSEMRIRKAPYISFLTTKMVAADTFAAGIGGTDIEVDADKTTFDGTVSASFVKSSGRISANSALIHGNVTGSGNLEITGNISGSASSTGSFGNVSVSGHFTGGGLRGYFDGGENNPISQTGTSAVLQFLDYNNGTIMTDNLGYRMPRAGSITAVSFNCNVTTATAGVITGMGDQEGSTVKIVVRHGGNSVFSAQKVDIQSTGVKGSKFTQAVGIDTFAAGDVLSLRIEIEPGGGFNNVAGNYSDLTLTDPNAVLEVTFDD